MVKYCLLGLTGIAAGVVVAGSLFTFLNLTGVPHRLMDMTHTSRYHIWYEWMISLGGISGNIMWLMQPSWHLGRLILVIAGISIGIFVGCFISAIAEVLDAFPVFLRRTRIKKGVTLIVIAMALGKAVGSWLWYFKLYRM